MVTGARTIDTAAEAFENIFKSILNAHAPTKVFHMRKNYSPFVSVETKELNLDRKAFQEEAAKTKQNTIDTLGPTLRDTPGAELWWLWNPESSQDPMSKEFINPYRAELDKFGFYEDEHHLIIHVSHKDNPWFKWDESLSQELAEDKIAPSQTVDVDGGLDINVLVILQVVQEPSSTVAVES